MSLESIDSEITQLGNFEISTADLEGKSTSIWNGRIVNKAQIEQQTRLVRGDILLCGEKVDGKASVSGSADTEGNKQAELEIEGSNKDGNVSASFSGSISQNKEGKTSGEIKGKVEVRF